MEPAGFSLREPERTSPIEVSSGVSAGRRRSGGAMSRKNPPLPPVHPGEILREDLMKPLGLSINALARDLRVPVTRVSEIVNGRRSITADTALRLARYFGNTPQFWLSLQATHDLEVATRRSVGQIERDVHPREAA